jgi:hypothetical protein
LIVYTNRVGCSTLALLCSRLCKSATCHVLAASCAYCWLCVVVKRLCWLGSTWNQIDGRLSVLQCLSCYVAAAATATLTPGTTGGCPDCNATALVEQVITQLNGTAGGGSGVGRTGPTGPRGAGGVTSMTG